MAKAQFHRLFNATDVKRGVSMRIEPHEAFRTYPAWVIDKAEAAGAATRYVPPTKETTDQPGD
ncbi:hypothetical protein [Falsirhodobacter halotolerans]|uniref:hypothetical protein n=1 Tax=Falsirhodobacter halotolerans TaxID=1146892 RepID=UPI001FD3339D|nr:hypothetical protein [Falsirhodobacter halotolerans]MCJ8138605.1 hypothetical protein [Falsirhodobacter halotolerans]